MIQLLTLALCLSFVAASAQQGSAMDYTASSSTVSLNGQVIAITSVLTKSGDTFTWTQNNTGTPLMLSFSITESSGNWDESTSLGVMTYSLYRDGETVSMTLVGDSTGLLLTMAPKDFESPDQQYIFNIATISYQ